MAQGRCAGCGKTSASCKLMDRHIVSCPDFIALYKQDPSRALDPRREYDRWSSEENSPEARAVAKDRRLAATFARLDEKREVQAGRWATPKDPLDD